MSLKAGKAALIAKKYLEAIAILNEFCRTTKPANPEYVQAQMWLVIAYQRTGRSDKAIAICEQYQNHDDPQVQNWAEQSLIRAKSLLELVGETAVIKSKPNRYRRGQVTLSLPWGRRLWFRLAMVATVAMWLGMILLIFLGLIYIITPTITWGWFYLAIALSLSIGTLLFFMAPWLIDICHRQIYRPQWLTLADLEPKVPEAVTIIEEFCHRYSMDIPKIAMVSDPNPLTFLYGVLPNSTRLIITSGLLQTLDDDEIAAVIAQQLSHVANWSFAVLTMVTAPAQIIYLFHVWFTRIGFRVGKHFWQVLAAIAYASYRLVSYFSFALSRSSSYICDYEAAQITGNPNAITRSLAKTARRLEPNRLSESSLALSMCDYGTGATVGIVFQILYGGYTEVSRQNLYKVFLWDLVNPWAIWLELHSPQPMIGKRIAALTAYAQQLGLNEEYDFKQILQMCQSRQRWDKNFVIDLIIETAPYTGTIAGLVTAFTFYWLYNNWLPLSLVAIGWGLGIMLQGSLRYPDYQKVVATNLANLLIDPHTSPVRAKPVQIIGELVGYSDSDRPDLELRLEDQAAIMRLHYVLDFRTFFTNPNIILHNLEILIGETVTATGWFRRSNFPILDVSTLQPTLLKLRPLQSHHQLWNNAISTGSVLAGLTLLAATSLF